MVKRKYAGEKEIRDKISLLFDYRKLTDALDIAGLSQDRKFVDQLHALQLKIYLLDAYLEGHWELDSKELEGYWKEINTALASMQCAPGDIEELVHEIRDYEKIERNCRADVWPTRISFTRFYTTKSCDVRLNRRLIYMAHPDLNKIWKEKAWRYYDLITEINDDIEDIREDLATYNANRFMISVLRKGMRKTARQYEAYLLKITDRAIAYFEKHRKTGRHDQLYTWTLERSQETIQLLHHTVENTDPETVSRSYLLPHMK